MHRVFVPAGAVQGDWVRLTGAVARQLSRVLRLRPGDRFAAVDPSGTPWLVEVAGASPDEVRGIVVGRESAHAEPRVRVTLVQAIPRGDRFDGVVQKVTELGVHAIWPVVTERSVVRPDAAGAARRVARWAAIAREAAELCGRVRAPEVAAVRPFDAALADLDPGGRWLIPWEEERRRSLEDALAAAPGGAGTAGAAPGAVTVFIGPEGGFSAAEVARAADRGALPVTLGPRILRADTAGIAAVCMILFALGELGARREA